MFQQIVMYRDNQQPGGGRMLEHRQPGQTESANGGVKHCPPTFLFMTASQLDSFDSAVFQNEITRRGFRLECVGMGKPSQEVPNLVGILINTSATERSLTSSF